MVYEVTMPNSYITTKITMIVLIMFFPSPCFYLQLSFNVTIVGNYNYALHPRCTPPLFFSPHFI